ncbi:MAG: hypothetical protein KDA63_11785 [Planctomycetales bacterium]|nr:hypothetical protein [Planctomycetales bacterium]
MVYAPKMPLAQRILDEVFTPAVRPALAGNMGLPGNEDLAALREFAAGRHVCFLGDCDPPDLLVFAWLRSQLGMIYVGLCDRMLADSGVVLDETCVIALSAAERQARHLMHRAVPDLRELVGDKCAALLDGGAKVELEAMNRSGAASLSKLARLFG